MKDESSQVKLLVNATSSQIMLEITQTVKKISAKH